MWTQTWQEFLWTSIPICSMAGLTPSAALHRVWLWDVIMSPPRWRPAASSNSVVNPPQSRIQNSLSPPLQVGQFEPATVLEADPTQRRRLGPPHRDRRRRAGRSGDKPRVPDRARGE